MNLNEQHVNEGGINYTKIVVGERELWKLNGKWHRELGPAVTAENGNQYWYINGVLHREDGPAIIRGGQVEYWFWGKQCNTITEFEQIKMQKKLEAL